MKIAERLLQLRKESGLTLRELSEKVGITAAALSSYEKGQKEPSLEFTIRLAKFYGKSLDNICGVEDVEQDQSYADVLMFILKTNASLGGSLKSEGPCVRGEGKKEAPSRSIRYRLATAPHGVEFKIDMRGEKVYAFFDTYLKLATLAESGAIPMSVFTNWLDDALADEAKIPLSQGMTPEERAEALAEYMSDAREIGV